MTASTDDHAALDEPAASVPLTQNERIKAASGFLRGTLADGLIAHATGAISEDDGQLVKFHGVYLQDDRDLRAERTRKKLEKVYAFMIRLRVPGGFVTPAQWITLTRSPAPTRTAACAPPRGRPSSSTAC